MTTLAQLRTRFYNRFDSGQSGYIGTAEANNLINEGARHLHNWLVSEAEYYQWREIVYPLNQGQSDYGLPADFQKLLKVFAPQIYSSPSATPTWQPLRRLMPSEYRGPSFGALQGPYPLVPRAYMLMGQTLRILPLPPANPGNILIWYVPKYVDLVLDTDSTELANDTGWEEFIVNQAVIGARIKEESDTGPLQDRQQQIMALIQSSIINRDMGQTAHVVDVDQSDRF